eukprot:12595544-Alexandrium_andersonii.AAC.1
MAPKKRLRSTLLGWRSRAAASNPPGGTLPPANAHGPPSHLCERVLQQWAWGFLSAPTVQSIMEGAVLDGATNPLIQQLAGIGSHGRHPHNCHRDLLRACSNDMDIPPPYVIKVPAKDPKAIIEKGSENVEVDCHTLLPHQLFSLICEKYKSLLQEATNNY